MPLTVAPDPANPGKWIWVDSATGQPAAQPGGPGTPYVASSGQPQNIDPNASYGPPRPTPTQQAQQGATVAGQTTPTVGTAQGPGGMFTPDQMTAQSASEVQQANLNVAATWEQIRQQQDLVARYQSGNLQAQAVANPNLITAASSTLNSLYSQLSAAEQRVETANAAYSTALGKAVVDPAQVNLQNASAAKADADAATARAQAQVLTDGAPGQRALVAAQAGQASAAAAAQQAAADATQAKTPAEVGQLQAQASALTAQATQTQALLPGLIQKQQAEVGLTEAQTGLVGSQSDLAQAQAGLAQANADLTGAQADYQRGLLAAGGPQATVGLQQAQAGSQQAQAAEALANIQKGQLGPMYGLQDQLNAIRAIQQQVFGPGGSGDPAHADDLLQQYTTAAISGTTPYAANIAAANFGQNQFATQASMYNAAQQALSSRANALTGLAGGVLGTLGTMNANAPAGSTAMAGAFQDVMDYAARQIAQQQQTGFGGGPMPQQPQAPQLPGLLARLAGTQPTGAPAFPSPGAAQPQTSAPVTINIGGQGQGQAQAQAPAPVPPPGGYAPPAAQPGTYGALTGSMPALLQKNMPLSPQEATDYWHQINGVQPPSSS